MYLLSVEGKNEVEIVRLDEYWSYNIRVEARTEDGVQNYTVYSDQVSAKTAQSSECSSEQNVSAYVLYQLITDVLRVRLKMFSQVYNICLKRIQMIWLWL